MRVTTWDWFILWLNVFFALVNLGLFVFGSHSPISLIAGLFSAGISIWFYISLRKRQARYDDLMRRAGGR